MDAYRENLAELFRAKNIELKAASMALGKNHAYLYQHIHKGSPKKLDGDDRRKLAMMLGVRESDLLQEGETVNDMKPIAVYKQGEDYTKIPVYDVACSAGDGAMVEAEHILYHASFPTPWLKSITSTPIHKLAVIRVQGDSMIPTLSNDDTVLVDMTQTYPRGDGIYVVIYDDLCLVKRVRVDPVRKLASVISDNPYYSPVENLKPEEIRVVGRVIWLGRRV